MVAVIVQALPDQGFRCYGAAADFWEYKGHEAMLAGPYETGKTMGAIHKLHTLLAKYASAQALMVRQTYKSLVASAVATYEKKVLPYPPGHPKCAVQKYGGSRPEWYDYPNGSRLYLGGMDNADKFLSSEFDFIYVNQAEELALDSWEKLTGRATGRAGNVPYSQVFGDCNPGPPTHWIINRKPLKVFKSRHEDNPTLFDPLTGEITEQGKRSLATLDNLTGVRYKRGRLGIWAGVEGQVYEDYNSDLHLIDRFDIPKDWRRFRSIDFGYRNPFVCQWWAADEDDRLYLYRELYMTGRTVAVHAEKIKRYSEGESYEFTVADHDAEDRATLAEHGIRTIAARKEITVGIEKVQERLKVQGDKRARIYFLRDALIEPDHTLEAAYKPLCTVDEITSYAYPEPKEDKSEDEKPSKVDDHGMDAMRYMVMAIEHPNRGRARKLYEW